MANANTNQTTYLIEVSNGQDIKPSDVNLTKNEAIQRAAAASMKQATLLFEICDDETGAVFMTIQNGCSI